MTPCKASVSCPEGQSALCGLAFLHCFVENCQEMAINFLKFFSEIFPVCHAEMCSGITRR